VPVTLFSRNVVVDDARHVFQLAVVGPLGRDLEVEHVAVGDVGHVARVERGHGLGNHFLRRVERQLDLVLGILLLELLDGVVQRRVFRRVEALLPPDNQFLLRGGLGGRRQAQGSQGHRDPGFQFHRLVSLGLSCASSHQ
jgi:hypothetical protein